jgi:hypothetical protein
LQYFKVYLLKHSYCQEKVNTNIITIPHYLFSSPFKNQAKPKTQAKQLKKIPAISRGEGRGRGQGGW